MRLFTFSALTTLIAAGLLVPSTSQALFHAGNPVDELRIREATGWTAEINNVFEGSAEYQKCSTGEWITATVVYDASGQKVGWERPQGTWCAMQVNWTSPLDIDLDGPAGRHVDATIDLPSVTVTLHNPTTTGTDVWLLELGLGDWLKMGEAYMDPGETLVVSPPSAQHDAILDNMDDGYLYVDLDANAYIDAAERSAGTIGE